MSCFCRVVIIACAFVWGAAATARTLHYGDSAVELTSEKVTSPALHVQLDNGEMAYGALYDAITTCVPQNMLHIAYDDKEYWLGPACYNGTRTQNANCDCGYGYYCPDADTRIACTGGAIACNTKNAIRDATVDSDYLNRLLTMEEANELLPVTDICEYEELSELYNWQGCSNTDNVRTGTLYPGTYLFILVIDNIGCSGKTNPTNGKGGIINAYTVIFDHAVSVESLAKCGAFRFSIDTSGPEYKKETFRIPYVCDNQQWTSVTGLGIVSAGIHIYRLK